MTAGRQNDGDDGGHDVAAAGTTSQHADQGSQLAQEELRGQRTRRHHAVVIVLGDVGRSPRMQYHALSLLESGYRVSLLGYEGADLVPSLQRWEAKAEEQGRDGQRGSEEERFRVVRFLPRDAPPILRTKKILKPLYYAFRFVELLRVLVHALLFRVGAASDVDCLLLQNPPSIPLMFVSYLYCALWCGGVAGLVVDWHNLGYTMFEVSDGHPIRRVAYWYERIVSRWADGHLCVTKAMTNFLRTEFHLGNTSGGRVRVLYDRPPDFFRRTTDEERNDLMARLGEDGTLPQAKELTAARERRTTSLVMSSTSWTPDEDFAVLLDALVLLDQKAANHDEESALLLDTSSDDGSSLPFPKVAVVVTGKGPEKQMFVERIATLAPQLDYVTVVTPWLEAGDYPRLLGCADLGVCLHSSTSGLDLPMKVLDMFGSEVPVCAIDYDCLDELVKDGTNGMVFRSAEDLAGQMYELLRTFRGADIHGRGRLEGMRGNVRGMTRWREEWRDSALPLIRDVCAQADERRAEASSRMLRRLGVVAWMFLGAVGLVIGVRWRE